VSGLRRRLFLKKRKIRGVEGLVAWSQTSFRGESADPAKRLVNQEMLGYGLVCPIASGTADERIGCAENQIECLHAGSDRRRDQEFAAKKKCNGQDRRSKSSSLMYPLDHVCP